MEAITIQKRQPMEQEKIFAIYILDRRLIIDYIKKSQDIELNRQLFKKQIQIANKYCEY